MGPSFFGLSVLEVTDTAILHLAMQVIQVCLKLSMPILATALAIGFTVSLFQSMTQIQEVTLSFVPKVLGVSAVLLASEGATTKERPRASTTLAIEGIEREEKGGTTASQATIRTEASR